jgi:predicted AAA+ superfamily ATPase
VDLPPLFPRLAQQRLRRLLRGFPIVVVTGPRQSGKTTLVRTELPTRPYVSLEDPDVRARVAADPRGFLAAQADGAVFDEVQRVPELLSYLQTAVDRDRRPGRWVLTGSQNLLLSAAVAQSLAGRAGCLELLPLAYGEAASHFGRLSLDELLVRGAYPAVHAHDVAAADWHASYVASYLERDVRQIGRIGDLLLFQRFLRMMAARCGQLLNLNALAHDLGIAQTTARDWLAVLEATYIVFRLPPYHANVGKRLVKTPKLYFHDTGLAARLLGIADAVSMNVHPMRGALFENLGVAELLRHLRHSGAAGEAFFWRDNIGNEVDLIVERAGVLQPIEFKSGATFQPEWLRSLHTWQRHAATLRQAEPMLVCGAPGVQRLQGIGIAHWREALLALHEAGPEWS